jgi:hypothetical protein
VIPIFGVSAAGEFLKHLIFPATPTTPNGRADVYGAILLRSASLFGVFAALPHVCFQTFSTVTTVSVFFGEVAIKLRGRFAFLTTAATFFAE